MWKQIKEARHFEPLAFIGVFLAVLAGALSVAGHPQPPLLPAATPAPGEGLNGTMATLAMIVTFCAILLGAATFTLLGELKKAREDSARTLQAMQQAIGAIRRG